MAFELKRFGIGIKTIAPGGIATDFAGRSMDNAPSEAYDGLMNKVWNAFAGMFTYSTPEQIAAVVYEAATDGKDRLHYAAGEHMAEKKEPGIAGLRSIKFSHVSS